jgi:hypothetical protein
MWSGMNAIVKRKSPVTVTKEEAKKIRHALKQVREGKTIPWPRVKVELGL